MRYISILIMLIFHACTQVTPPCVNEDKIDPDVFCTMEYKPVCGCDEVTYGNECEAEKWGVTRWKEGECEHPETERVNK
jgi:hypothetical protein